MEKEQLEVLREKYNKLKDLREKQKPMLDRLNELEENEIVKEYNELKLKYKRIYTYDINDLYKKSDSEIAFRAAKECDITPNSNIFVYLYTSKNGEEIEKYRNDMDFAAFKNIEDTSKYCTLIKPNELEDFLKNNIIISENYSYVFPADLFFQLAQADYFETIIKEGKEKTIKKFKNYHNEKQTVKILR